MLEESGDRLWHDDLLPVKSCHSIEFPMVWGG